MQGLGFRAFRVSCAVGFKIQVEGFRIQDVGF